VPVPQNQKLSHLAGGFCFARNNPKSAENQFRNFPKNSFREKKTMSKAEILKAIRSCARKLKRNPTRAFQKKRCANTLPA
jgi:hypothetical protein